MFAATCVHTPVQAIQCSVSSQRTVEMRIWRSARGQKKMSTGDFQKKNSERQLRVIFLFFAAKYSGTNTFSTSHWNKKKKVPPCLTAFGFLPEQRERNNPCYLSIRVHFCIIARTNSLPFLFRSMSAIHFLLVLSVFAHLPPQNQNLRIKNLQP